MAYFILYLSVTGIVCGYLTNGLKVATISRWRYEFESRYPYKFIIPDRWVKSALEIWVNPEIITYHLLEVT